MQTIIMDLYEMEIEKGRTTTTEETWFMWFSLLPIFSVVVDEKV